MKIVRTAIGVTPYEATVTAGRHTLIADEPESRGGRDAGPAPYDLLLASLGACSAITLRMYADRKQLTIRSLQIELSFHKEGERSVIRRVVHLDADLTPEQRARFADIIERTPVTLTLKTGSDIRTEFKEL
jgi:putative redox protein